MKIQKVVIMEGPAGVLDEKDDEMKFDYRPKVKGLFESVYGMQKTFGFMCMKPDVVAQREWDCWCPACFCSIAGPTAHGSRMVNNGSEQGYVVLGCTSQERWFDCTVQRKDAVGVHVR